MDLLASYRISVPGSTQDTDESQIVFVYRTCTFYGRLFNTIQLTIRLVTLICRSYNPILADGLG